MKIDISLNDLIDDDAFQDGIEVISKSDGDFVSMSKMIGLVPSSDFRFSNLCGVDFSYCDLRGFDFTGADLTNATGMDVIVDGTTLFSGATLQGSVFERRLRNEAIIANMAGAEKAYEALKSGDTYDVSSWISAKKSSFAPPILRNITREQASALCQRLIVDEIDLTKRTTLFFELRGITSNRKELHQVVSDFVAFHLENTNVIRAFIRVAADLFPNDKFISKKILSLCGHRNMIVRAAAFASISNTKIFDRNFNLLRELFLHDGNRDLRKRIILETAIGMGRNHVLAINTAAATQEVELDSVLDFHDLRIESSIEDVRRSQLKRSSPQVGREIKSYQEEVMAYAPFISKMLSCGGQEWLQAARERMHSMRRQEEMALSRRVERALAR